MERLTVLGTGNAMSVNYYNTCFTIDDGEEYFLVDAGGGNGIFLQLQKTEISFQKIHHMFVTHGHTDHILGVIWVIRKIAAMMKTDKYKETFTIYCQTSLVETIKSICYATLQSKFTKLFDDRILFVEISDNMQLDILGRKVTFFDIHSTKAEQHGFMMNLKNGKTLTCLGDEPMHESCIPYIKDCDWLLCEAFCLYDERDIFKPYEKHHSTVKEASETAEQYGVKNLVLWHTEDSHGTDRKDLYTAEGKTYYSKNLFVPDDLEKIIL